MPNWDGKTERRGNPNDHDNITRLLISVESHVKNFDKHVEDDKNSFTRITSRVDKHAIYIYMALGALAILQFLVKH